VVQEIGTLAAGGATTQRGLVDDGRPVLWERRQFVRPDTERVVGHDRREDRVPRVLIRVGEEQGRILVVAQVGVAELRELQLCRPHIREDIKAESARECEEARVHIRPPRQLARAYEPGPFVVEPVDPEVGERDHRSARCLVEQRIERTRDDNVGIEHDHYVGRLRERGHPLREPRCDVLRARNDFRRLPKCLALRFRQADVEHERRLLVPDQAKGVESGGGAHVESGIGNDVEATAPHRCRCAELR